MTMPKRWEHCSPEEKRHMIFMSDGMLFRRWINKFGLNYHRLMEDDDKAVEMVQRWYKLVGITAEDAFEMDDETLHTKFVRAVELV